jgi:hypothetical protein
MMLPIKTPEPTAVPPCHSFGAKAEGVERFDFAVPVTIRRWFSLLI